MIVSIEKRNSPCCLAAHTGGDSLENPTANSPKPLDYSREKVEQEENFPLALAALSADEFYEWITGLGCTR